MTSPQPVGLGRRFAGHDEQSRAYGVRADMGPAKVIRKPTYWRMPTGPFPLDQGAEGACTGFGMAQELAAGPVVIPGVDNAYALHRYERNREVDRSLGNIFPDGATVLATMKAAQADGLITGYRWAFGIDDVIDAVCSVGPVLLGIEWRQDMYATDSRGVVSANGPVVGGHCLPVLGYDVHPQAGPCALLFNSWGKAYGVASIPLGVSAGVGWMPLPVLASLLAADGEAVIPADFLAVPSPVQPVPAPAPRPKPTRRRRPSWWPKGWNW